jgi:hypothetical protein
MMEKENLMGRTRPHSLPTSRRRWIRRKEYATSVVILIIGIPIPNRFDKCHQGKGGKTVNTVIGDT